MNMVKRYEPIEHTADIAVKAYGDTLDEAFACSADAMFDVITESAEIKKIHPFHLEVESDDLESLLVKFLSQMIAIHEIEQIVLTDFNISLNGTYNLTATAHSEPFDPVRHGNGHHIKGISYHMMEIYDGKGKQPSFVQVLFDV